MGSETPEDGPPSIARRQIATASEESPVLVKICCYLVNLTSSLLNFLLCWGSATDSVKTKADSPL